MSTPDPITQIAFNSAQADFLTAEVMSVDELRLRASAEHFQKPMRADFYRLYGIQAGDAHFMVDFVDLHLKPMDWLLIRPGQVMQYDFALPWQADILVFRPDALMHAQHMPALGELAYIHQTQAFGAVYALDANQHLHFLNILQQIKTDRSLPHPVPVRNELIQLELTSLMIRLSLCRAKTSPQKPLNNRIHHNFNRFCQRLESDFAKHHQVQHYAQALGLSDKSLGRICLSVTGLSTKACIAQRIILESKRLLAHTSLPIQHIGFDLGFDDPTNFVKYFKRETGITPLSFRELDNKT